MNEREFYSRVEPRNDWAFAHLSRTETKEVTHSYHNYPAKFIPQLARSLIEEYTDKSDIVWDPFCGSGTLNVEAFRTNRHSIGTDINPIAVTISRVKTTLLETKALTTYNKELFETLETYPVQSKKFYITNGVLNGNVSVLKKWFSEENLQELGHILWCIKDRNTEKKHRDFALCAFSSILKNCSYWLASSVKSQIDPHKLPGNPLLYFEKRLKAMEKANNQFYHENKSNNANVHIFRHDAKRNLPSKIPKMDCIITSPPYVISYDYSNIFKLSTYFLFYQQDYAQFRKTFIGTTLRKNTPKHHNIPTPWQSIINSVSNIQNRRTLAEYYNDMSIFFKNVKRNLKENGRLVMVVGDTEQRGIMIPNAYLLTKIANNFGWSLENVFKREIPVKTLPTFRDATTGKFTNKENPNSLERYNYEYVLVLRR
ncbi:MAG: class I SAM-dependent methyltransferase [Thermoplasmata archaeon]